MKTQLFTFATGLIFLLSINNSKAAEKTNSENSLDNVSVKMLVSIFETSTPNETLLIEDWMTNDELWEANEDLSSLNEPAIEEELELEDWMTNTEVWDYNYTISTVFVSRGKVYQVIRPSHANNAVDQPLGVERWMLSNYLWRM